MAKVLKEGKHTYWIDGEGLKVPYKHVHESDRIRDRAVTSLVSRAKRLQTIIKNEKRGDGAGDPGIFGRGCAQRR